MAYRKVRNIVESRDETTGFLNIRVPTKSGGTKKLAYKPFKAGDAADQQLQEWILENPEKHLEILRKKLVLDFQEYGEGDSNLFDLG